MFLPAHKVAFPVWYFNVITTILPSVGNNKIIEWDSYGHIKRENKTERDGDHIGRICLGKAETHRVLSQILHQDETDLLVVGATQRGHRTVLPMVL